MRDLNSTHTRRCAAGVMGFMMLLIVLFSAFYITVETDHDCSGEDCPICICVERCDEMLHQVASGAVALAAVVVPVICILHSAILLIHAFSQGTLVSQKVRLNN